jgi:hypothetical protein
MFWLVANGKKRAIRTRLSHGQSEADAWLQSQIAKQMHLTASPFREFVDCRMGARSRSRFCAEWLAGETACATSLQVVSSDFETIPPQTPRIVRGTSNS